MRTKRPVLDRFMEKVETTDDGCMVWTASGNGAGYGAITIDGRRILAHRWAYEHFVGPIPDGMHIDHLCRNRACVNPDHLEPVNHRTNVLRGIAPTAVNAAKTHCPQGHPYDEGNTAIYRSKRTCRTCHRDKASRYYAENRAQVLEKARHRYHSTKEN